MIEEFLRRPATASEFAADGLRVIGALSVLVAAVRFGATDAGILAFLLPGLLLPRFLGARSGFDIAYCLVLLVAGWSNVFDLYTRIAWWDVVVHVACTGALAAVLVLLLRHVGVSATTAAGAVVLTTLVGLAISALWEMVEWFGHAVISSAIFVEYDDTIGDMLAGGLGSLAAGVAVATVRLTRNGVSPRTGV